MEWPRASVQPAFHEDHDLWIACMESPSLYVRQMRLNGLIGPPNYQPVIARIPNPPIATEILI